MIPVVSPAVPAGIPSSEPAPTTPSRSAGARFEERLASAPSAPPPSSGPSLITRIFRGVATGQHEMDRIVREARSGRSFSPAELIGLQARVYRLSQEMDLASKLVEKATNGVKQAMGTQV